MYALQKGKKGICCMARITMYQAKKDKSVLFYEHYTLTVDETAAYFHIGAKKMHEIINNHEGVKWYLYSGKRIMIKRELFGKWLDPVDGNIRNNSFDHRKARRNVSFSGCFCFWYCYMFF